MEINTVLMNSSTVFFGDGAEGLGSECRISLKIYKQDTLPVKRDAARKERGVVVGKRTESLTHQSGNL